MMKQLFLGLLVAAGITNAAPTATKVATQVGALTEALTTTNVNEGRQLLLSRVGGEVNSSLGIFSGLHADIKAGKVKINDVKNIAEKYSFSANQTLTVIGELRKAGKAITAANVEGTSFYASYSADLKKTQVAAASMPQARVTSGEAKGQNQLVLVATREAENFFGKGSDAANEVAKYTYLGCSGNDCAQFSAAYGSIIQAGQKVCAADAKSCPAVKEAMGVYVSRIIPGLNKNNGVAPIMAAALPVAVLDGKLATDEIKQPQLLSGTINIVEKVRKALPKAEDISVQSLTPVVGKQLAEKCMTGKSQDVPELAL